MISESPHGLRTYWFDLEREADPQYRAEQDAREKHKLNSLRRYPSERRLNSWIQQSKDLKLKLIKGDPSSPKKARQLDMFNRLRVLIDAYLV